MNQRAYRLVFDPRRRMLVAAPEHARSAGKSARGEGWGIALAVAVGCGVPGFALAQQRPPVVFASQRPAPTYNLPQPYGTTAVRQVDGTFKLRTDRTFVANPQQASQINWTVDGKNATLDQGSVERAILNWDSFDIGAGYKVHFKQDPDPNKYVSALNRIWSLDPSLILGSLTADREVILVNANGVYFGRGARVDTGKLVASALGISDSVFEKGLRNVKDGSAVFSTAAANSQATNLDSAVTVEAGAELRTAAGGDVLLIAPRVVNQGRIETPGGQAILAAGDKVYLMSSSDPAQRGLIVAVDPIKVTTTATDPVTGLPSTTTAIDSELGIVENAAKGSYKTVDGATVPDGTPDTTSGLVTRLNEIRAESGTVNLVGLTVRQNGQINATTAVKGANGAIYLQAMASTTTLAGGVGAGAQLRGLRIDADGRATVGDQLGTVEIGPDSRTAVLPDGDASRTQLASETFNQSLIRVEGARIHVAAAASLEAPAGRIDLLAAQRAQASALFNAAVNTVAPLPDDSRVVIDPSARIDAGGLRDVAVDGERNQGDLRLFRIELADAPVQRDGALYRSQVFFDLRNADSIKVADVTGASNAIGRSAQELSTVGGAVRIEGEGAVVVGDGARINVAGGSLAVSEATLKSSLLSDNGRVVVFDNAAAGQRYDGVAASTLQRTVPAYQEGKDGGSLTVNGRQVYFGGDVHAGVVEGEYQRDGRDAPAKPSQLTFGRAIGNNYYLPAIHLGQARSTDAVSELLSDPFGASTGRLPSVLELPLADVQASAAGALQLRATVVDQPHYESLNLGARGRLDVQAQRIGLDGAFDASGGSIALSTTPATDTASALGDIRVSERSRLDTSGRWINDATGPATVQTAGGAVTLAAARSVDLAPGSVIDVSGGARISTSFRLSPGKAGSIAVSIGGGLPIERRGDASLNLGAELRGFDFQDGGLLALGVPNLTIGDPAATGFVLTPEFFGAHGFGSIAVNAFGDVRVAGDTTLTPQLRNWQLTPAARVQASGPMREAVATPVVLDSQLVQRKPVDLSLSATRPINQLLGLPGASVVVEPGAIVALEAGGKLALQATGNVTVGGDPAVHTTLQAPGGEVSLRITGPRGAATPDLAADDPAGFVPDQAVWVGRGTTISVAGAAQLRPDRSGPVMSMFAIDSPAAATTADRQVGTVWGGGTINLDAERGYVVAEAGSELRLDGAKALVNNPGSPIAVRLAKPAGTLNVGSPEGIALEGTVSARSPQGVNGEALADGGRLSLSVGVSGNLGGVSNFTQVNADNGRYPDAATHPRRVIVGDDAQRLSASEARPGDDLNALLGNGVGYASRSLLERSGFDAVSLAAADKISFANSVRLSQGLSIELNAPAIEASPGVQVGLRATHVAIGDSTLGRTSGAPAPDVSAAPNADPVRPSSLSIEAQTIDVNGRSGLRGFDSAALSATIGRAGEIRLMSYVPGIADEGVLNFAGSLWLTAGQVYASSASRFHINGLPADAASPLGAVVRISQPLGGSASAMPLSVFGSLSINADQIVQGGVLRQPFGAIELNASRELQLLGGSETSVSADGAVLPFGTTTNLAQWFTVGKPEELTALLQPKRITLKAPKLATEPTARVDASGGGDIQASEFFPGVGGSRDYFETPGLYAVLPDYATLYAPRSEEPSSAAAAVGGQQIVITMNGAGLAPGRYTLLPARYALLAGSLPRGAYLVRRAADQSNGVLSAPLRQDDGSVVVTGYMSQAGSRNQGVPGERFVVEGPGTFRAKSDIRLTSVTGLYRANAASQGMPTPSTPSDAGSIRVSTSAQEKTLLSLQLDLGAPAGARSGQLDVSAPKIALVDGADQLDEGTLGVTAASLTDSRAGSVLLGGLRSVTEATSKSVATTSIDSTSTWQVSLLASGAPVRVEELLLAARDTVSLGPGTTLQATAAASQGPHRLELTGDGALVAVSANPIEVRRSGAGGVGGDVRIGEGAQLIARSVAVDATAVAHIGTGARVAADVVAMGARHIAVGGPSDDPQATVLDGQWLTSMRRADDLTLRSDSSIDFVGDQDWAQRRADGQSSAAPPVPTQMLRQLTLDAPSIRGVDGSGAAGVAVPGRVDIAAEQVTLRNSSGLEPVVANGHGSLLLEARPPLQYGSTGGIAVGPGSVALQVASAELRSRGDIVLDGVGGLRAQGDLALSASRLTASSGAIQFVEANQGRLSIGGVTDGHSLHERVGQGASVSLSAQAIEQAGTIDLPGGWLTLSASGTSPDAVAIRFAPGSVTYAGGYTVDSTIAGWSVDGHAGQVNARAATGRIEQLGTIDVSATRRSDGSFGRGDAGRIELSATGEGGRIDLVQDTDASGVATRVEGRLLGIGGSGRGDRGGQLSLDARAQGTADAWARQAVDGGFSDVVSLRARSGDVMLTTGLKSGRIVVSADQGRLVLDGAALDARAPSGGVVQLSAGADLVLGGSTQLDARSSRAGANGGDVLLASSGGTVRVGAGVRIDAGGDDPEDGRIVLRAQRGSDNASVLVDPLSTQTLSAGEVAIEAVKTYRSIGAAGAPITSIAAGASQGNTLGQDSVHSDSTTYMAQSTGVLAALGAGGDSRVHLRAGVEVQAEGDLALRSDWALQLSRPGNEAGMLTLRAGGNLNLDGSLSDGFDGTMPLDPVLASARSWSYRLVGGADLSAANPMATIDRSAAAADSGNLTVAQGRLVRTGAGSIELAAGRDIRLGGSGAAVPGVVYVAGRPVANQTELLSTLFIDQASQPTFTERGGRLELNAARDITAPPSNQLINNWFWRTGLPSADAGEEGLYSAFSHLAWWTEFARYQQGVGSFGGGSVEVRAGRDISNLTVVAPTNAWADDRQRASARIVVNGGGDVDVRAGRDVVGGQYFAARGQGSLAAGGSVKDASAGAVTSPILAQMDGSWRVQARSDLSLATAFNPTAVAVSAQDGRTFESGLFYTYGDGAGVQLEAASGNINLNGIGATALSGYRLDATNPSASPLFQMMPANLTMHALAGDVRLFAKGEGAALLLPSTQSGFELFAGGDFVLGAPGSTGRVAMGDFDLGQLPDVRTPLSNVQAKTALAARNTGLIDLALQTRTTSGGTLALGDGLPHAGLRSDDTEPARIHADGAIKASAGSAINVAKAADVSAGGDIDGLTFIGLNLGADDVTSIRAGRNLIGDVGGVLLAGPGDLQVMAGRQLDLGTSFGITTSGSLNWPGGPRQGANVTVAAATDGVLNSAAFEVAFLQPSTALGGSSRWLDNQQLLLQYVRKALNTPDLDYEQAWQRFQTFPAAARSQLARQVLAAEFGATYLTSAPTGSEVLARLSLDFDRHRSDLLAAGAQALASGQSLTLPGNEVLSGDALRGYLDGLRGLSFASLELKTIVDSRVKALQGYVERWRDLVAAQFGSTAQAMDALAASNPADAVLLRYRAALQEFSGGTFERFRGAVLAQETASSGDAASNFGLKSLPMRMALYDQGFQVAELAGVGNFSVRPIWSGLQPVFDFSGAMNLTQSSVITRRGGDVALINAGGPVNVGLKDSDIKTSDITGVVALGGGDVFGFAKNDFQVNNQRVFIVGEGNMNLWSSAGDIDSGRGANTAVGAPPLAARRSVDGVVFEVPPITTGSGLAILSDASGRRMGSIGLYPAFGEILALDAFIRAPVVRLGSSVRGADNIQAPSISGATAAVAAPTLNASLSSLAPPTTGPEASPGSRADGERPRSSLLTVELLGLGTREGATEAQDAEDCELDRERCSGTTRPRPGAR